MKKNLCKIIGVLDDGAQSLDHSALQTIKAADCVIGGERVLSLFSHELSSHCEKRDLTGCLSKVPQWVKESLGTGKRVVILATGDPLCHGMGSYLVDKIGNEHCTIIPNVSTIQLACARIGLSWQDIKISSVHTKDAGEWQKYSDATHGLYGLLQDLKQNGKLAVFTSPENNPERIARMMLQEGLDNKFHLAIIENLLTDKEAVHHKLSVSDITQHSYPSPNVVLLWPKTNEAETPLFGYADDYFSQRKPEKGLITKREVRAVSLARMQLNTNSLVWDIGAGSGSVGLEAARIAFKGHVYGIEKNAADLENIEKNRMKMGITNYSLFHGKAPQHLEHWSDPNAIFIGGTGGEVAELIQLALSRLKNEGWLVMNFVTFENLSSAIVVLKDNHAQWDICQMQVSRSKPILHMNRLAAENPVWIVSAQRGET